MDSQIVMITSNIKTGKKKKESNNMFGTLQGLAIMGSQQTMGSKQHSPVDDAFLV